jgi:MFS family permease
MNLTMDKKQLSALFFCNLAPATIGFGIVSLIPVHATRNLGAAPAVTGYLLAFLFFAQALGTITAGILSDKF